MIKWGEYTINKNNRTVSVNVEPPCISANREYEYIYNTLSAYDKNALTEKMKITTETETEITITYYR